jgi:probable addiction module antidote protein
VAKSSRFGVTECLNGKNDIKYFLDDAFSTGDAAYIAHCLGVVARSKGMSKLARDMGVSREQLYRSFSENGNPTLRSFISLISALNMKLLVKAVPRSFKHGEGNMK